MFPKTLHACTAAATTTALPVTAQLCLYDGQQLLINSQEPARLQIAADSVQVSLHCMPLQNRPLAFRRALMHRMLHLASCTVNDSQGSPR
jgi:hypothetical protein